MEGKDKKFKAHVIICGLGATAIHIIEELESSRKKTADKDDMADGFHFRNYLVIDCSEEAIEKMSAKWPEMNCLVGDATDDDILEQANIRGAYGIFPVLSSEKDNLYITMAARQFNPRIRIVARTADLFNIGKKLFKGGANSVVSPNFMGGLRLVSEIARPHATDFLDELLHETNMWLQIAEVVVSPESSLSGLSLRDAEVPKKCGLNIIAVKKRGDRYYTYNPSATERIEHGDTLVVLGYRDQVAELRKETGAGQ
ncbi:potassium channel family protein [Thermodesulfobacteriota bacterium]